MSLSLSISRLECVSARRCLLRRRRPRRLSLTKKKKREENEKEERGERFKVSVCAGGSVSLSLLSPSFSLSRSLGRSISRATICRDAGGRNLTYPSNAGYPWTDDGGSMCVWCAATMTRARVRSDGEEDGEEDNVAYTPICPPSGIRGRENEVAVWRWLFAIRPRTLLSPSPKRVPSVEQRRHTNPHGYPGRRAEEE